MRASFIIIARIASARLHKESPMHLVFYFMYKMLMLLFLSSVVTVFGKLCEFPSDTPIRELTRGEVFPLQIVGANTAQVFTEEFSVCHGRVRAIGFCYRPGSGSREEELMTIEIRGPGNSGVQATHTVLVNPNTDRANYYCTDIYTSTEFNDCCVEQNLTDEFQVSSENNTYALIIPNSESRLVRDIRKIISGVERDQNGYPIGPQYKPLFYFLIDASSGKLCGFCLNSVSYSRVSIQMTALRFPP